MAPRMRPPLDHLTSVGSRLDMALRRSDCGMTSAWSGAGTAALGVAFDVDVVGVLVADLAGMGAGAGSGFSGGKVSELLGRKSPERRDVKLDGWVLSPLEDAMAHPG